MLDPRTSIPEDLRAAGESTSPRPATPIRAEAGSRLRIIAAALALFADQGFDDTTTSQIAESAGVSRSTLFRHFSTKRRLLIFGLDGLGRLLADGIAKAPATASPLGAVAAGLERAATALGQARSESSFQTRTGCAQHTGGEATLARTSIAAAIANALAARGTSEPVAELAAATAVLALGQGLARHRRANDGRDLSAFFIEALDEFGVATTALG